MTFDELAPSRSPDPPRRPQEGREGVKQAEAVAMRAQTNYVRIDNDLASSRKILDIRDDLVFAAIGLLVLAIGYADRQRTDGAISARAMRRAVALGLDADEIIAELVRVHFLDETADGYRIVGYLDWQRSADEIERALEQRREAGRKSAQERAKRTRDKDLDQDLTPTERRGEERIREDMSALNRSLNESFNGPLDPSLSDQSDPVGDAVKEAARTLSRRSPKPVTPEDVAAAIAKSAPDAMPSEIKTAYELVAADGSVRIPLSVFGIRLAEARSRREAF